MDSDSQSVGMALIADQEFKNHNSISAKNYIKLINKKFSTNPDDWVNRSLHFDINTEGFIPPISNAPPVQKKKWYENRPTRAYFTKNEKQDTNTTNTSTQPSDNKPKTSNRSKNSTKINKKS